MMCSKKVLVIAAHPDDEVLGCGGTIAKWAREGTEVYIAILGEGITSRYNEPANVNISLVQQLRRDAEEVGRLLGAKEIFFYGLPDNRFDTVPLLDIIKIIEKLIENVEPTIVFTHYIGDLNVDHVLTCRATLTATRPTTHHSVKSVYSYEVLSSTEWTFYEGSKCFTPNLFIDINSTLDIKVKAMQVYKSEIREFPHPRSSEAIRIRAKQLGTVVGIKAAEAFKIIREIR